MNFEHELQTLKTKKTKNKQTQKTKKFAQTTNFKQINKTKILNSAYKTN